MSPRIRLVTVLSVVALLGGSFLVGRGSSVVAPVIAAPTEAATPGTSAPGVAKATLAQAVAASPTDPGDDARVAKVHDGATLASYLDELEADAKERGLKGDEMARAVAAGRAAEASVGAVRASVTVSVFGDRVRALETTQRLKPARDALDGIAARIEAERDATKRQQLVAQYGATTTGLPPLDRLEAMERLNRLQ